MTKAKKLLAKMKMFTIATKGDVMMSIDPIQQGAACLVRSVNEARALLTTVGAKEEPRLKLMLDLATQMAEDTLLLLQAGLIESDFSDDSRRQGVRGNR